MKTITKNELLKNWEEQEYIQINFPEMEENEPIFLRSEVQRLDHFNMVYRDGKRVYLEDNVKSLVRLSRRIFGEEVWDCQIWEQLEYILYCANYDFKKAKELYLSRY